MNLSTNFARSIVQVHDELSIQNHDFHANSVSLRCALLMFMNRNLVRTKWRICKNYGNSSTRTHPSNGSSWKHSLMLTQTKINYWQMDISFRKIDHIIYVRSKRVYLSLGNCSIHLHGCSVCHVHCVAENDCVLCREVKKNEMPLWHWKPYNLKGKWHASVAISSHTECRVAAAAAAAADVWWWLFKCTHIHVLCSFRLIAFHRNTFEVFGRAAAVVATHETAREYLHRITSHSNALRINQILWVWYSKRESYFYIIFFFPLSIFLSFSFIMISFTSDSDLTFFLCFLRLILALAVRPCGQCALLLVSNNFKFCC